MFSRVFAYYSWELNHWDIIVMNVYYSFINSDVASKPSEPTDGRYF